MAVLHTHLRARRGRHGLCGTRPGQERARRGRGWHLRDPQRLLPHPPAQPPEHHQRRVDRAAHRTGPSGRPRTIDRRTLGGHRPAAHVLPGLQPADDRGRLRVDPRGTPTAGPADLRPPSPRSAGEVDDLRCPVGPAAEYLVARPVRLQLPRRRRRGRERRLHRSHRMVLVTGAEPDPQHPHDGGQLGMGEAPVPAVRRRPRPAVDRVGPLPHPRTCVPRPGARDPQAPTGGAGPCRDVTALRPARQGAPAAVQADQPLPLQPRARLLALPRAYEQVGPAPRHLLRTAVRHRPRQRLGALARAPHRSQPRGSGHRVGGVRGDRAAAVPAVDRWRHPRRPSQPAQCARARAAVLVGHRRRHQCGRAARQGPGHAAGRLLPDADDVGFRRRGQHPEPADPASGRPAEAGRLLRRGARDSPQTCGESRPRSWPAT